MQIVPRKTSIKGSESMFTGHVYLDEVVRGEEPSRVRVAFVHFTPGSRSAWHSHAVGQTFYIMEGLAVTQARGGEIIAARAGEAIYTPAGEWHWHGAARDRFMTHLAIWEAPGDGAESEWGDHVTDEEYDRQPPA